MKKRMANMELLRILSMLMVITLHYLGKGELLVSLTQNEMGIQGYVAWLLEAFAIVAVNVYMLTTGFFLAESSIKVSRILQLMLQVWFYAIGIGILAGAFGYFPEEGICVHYILCLIFPISMGHYWFMSAYIYMYLFIPFVILAVKKMSQKQMKIILAILVFVFSIIKSITPAVLEMDMQGYDCIWYLCMCVLAAYIRKYGFPFFTKKTKRICVYIVGALGIFGMTMLIRFVYLKYDALGTILTICYNYNHILVLIASVGLFYCFYQMEWKDTAFFRMVVKVAPYTLGVYLMHEHLAIRYQWQIWLGVENVDTVLSMFFNWIFAVTIVFVAGIVVDFLRTKLFGGIHRVLMKWKLYEKLIDNIEKLDGYMR